MSLLQGNFSLCKGEMFPNLAGRGKFSFIDDEFGQAQPKPQPANPQLGALFSQVWGTYTNTLHQE